MPVAAMRSVAYLEFLAENSRRAPQHLIRQQSAGLLLSNG
jgi:hypothetical protein